LAPKKLAEEVKQAEASLRILKILLTVSDLVYGFQSNDGAPALRVVDFLAIHVLPFFDIHASVGKCIYNTP
jgi:hypothetical protein